MYNAILMRVRRLCYTILPNQGVFLSHSLHQLNQEALIQKKKKKIWEDIELFNIQNIILFAKPISSSQEKKSDIWKVGQDFGKWVRNENINHIFTCNINTEWWLQFHSINYYQAIYIYNSLNSYIGHTTTTLFQRLTCH